MLKGGVIMDVTTPEQAKIAENSGAVAVMALERIPADIREDGGVARMSSPAMIKEIQNIVSIPVMAKCRIGHILEAKILEALEVDFIDESEVLTPADNENHIYKNDFSAPFVCGARDLGEALRRINEGAAMSQEAKASGNEYVTLQDHSTGNNYDLPLMPGTVGPKVIDVRPLYAQTGHFTYDPGYTSTGSCESKITYIDGEEGVLLHRGYPIEELAEQSNFLEICYLLLNGELPSKAEYEEFNSIITNHTMVHEQLHTLYRGFRRDAHPMAIMCGVVGALSAFYHDSTDINDPHQRMIASHRLIAKVPTIAAMAYKYSIGQPFVYPRNDLTYAENFLHMMFSVPTEDYKISPVVSRAMDRIFILHADHEQNASTSTVRMAGSSGANPFACIAAGIASLWGPAHGGAN